jgi:hypothetical protein
MKSVTQPLDARQLLWCGQRAPNTKESGIQTHQPKQEYSPKQILEWFVRRWQMEVTFEEERAHLGMETQRQWSDLAITRTTSILLGLFSLVTILAHHLQANFFGKLGK